MILVDTCVWLDIFDADERWATWSLGQVAQWKARGPLLIDEIIYAELCSNFDRIETLDAALEQAGVEWSSLSRSALFLAGQARALYKRRGGRGGLLPDFLIGAHASVLGCPILTRDVSRFRSSFPRLVIVAPDGYK